MHRVTAAAGGAALVSAFCLACTGCELLYFTAAGAASGPELTRRRIGERQCQSAACKPEDWFVPNFAASRVSFSWTGCFEGYDLDFVRESGGLIAVSVNASESLLLAIAAASGDVFIADFGSNVARTSVSLQAVGLAWSNAGDRLAIATLDSSSGAAALLIADAALSELRRYELSPLPAAAPDSLPRVAVSWSADDELVVVSSSAAPPASIVVLSSGVVRPENVYGAYFIGTNRMVANVGGNVGTVVRQITLNRDHADVGKVIAGAVRVLSSNPATGVFMTTEPDVPGMLQGNNAGLRTVDAGPSIAWSDARNVLPLVPLDEALPTLEASGYGPSTAPQPDENGGCP